MIGRIGQWEKLGRIVAPDPAVPWLATFAASSFALPVEDSSLVDLYIAGRDSENCSQIGRVRIDLTRPSEVLEISPEPVLDVGSLGAFDENGVSYPYLVKNGDEVYLYYTGWMPSVLTPFQNHLGLAARQEGGEFKRVSKAPILPRTDSDYLSIGSVCVLRKASDDWAMWYTSFRSWGAGADDPKHRYIIKYASSKDGMNWHRDNQVCIDTDNPGEHSICRPTVIQIDDTYHMWYAYRGEHYRIGYAHSQDGIQWKRRDDLVGIELSSKGWDSLAQAYPHVFMQGDYLYMIYNGNHYGKEGLGLARRPLSST